MATHAVRLGQWRIDGKAEASVEGIAPNSEAEEQFIRQYIKEQKEKYKREREEAKRREEQKEEEAKREREEAIRQEQERRKEEQES